MPKKQIFISYRRSDASGEAGRLGDSLARLLGKDSVFRDADGIRAGEDFAAVLERQLGAARALVVAIGPRWQEEMAARLQRPEPDWVRIEIATALRMGTPVIPVLLRGSHLPAADALPDDLRGLGDFQALTIRDEAWAHDTGRLADTIGRPYPWRRVLLRGAVALPGSILAAWLAVGALETEPERELIIARLIVIGLWMLYAAFEGFAWWRRPRGIADLA